MHFLFYVVSVLSDVYNTKTSKRRDDFFGMQSIDVISDICIVSTNKIEDLPSSDYYCITETVEGNYGGVNAGGYFNFNKLVNKHSGPFIAFRRCNKIEQQNLMLLQQSTDTLIIAIFAT